MSVEIHFRKRPARRQPNPAPPKRDWRDAMSDLIRVGEAARKYREAEAASTPRLWRGKELHELGLALDEAIERWKHPRSPRVSDG